MQNSKKDKAQSQKLNFHNAGKKATSTSFQGSLPKGPVMGAKAESLIDMESQTVNNSAIGSSITLKKGSSKALSKESKKEKKDGAGSKRGGSARPVQPANSGIIMGSSHGITSQVPPKDGVKSGSNPPKSKSTRGESPLVKNAGANNFNVTNAKKILYYTTFYSAERYGYDWKTGMGWRPFQDCPVSNCYFTKNKNMLGGSVAKFDALIFMMRSSNLMDENNKYAISSSTLSETECITSF